MSMIIVSPGEKTLAQVRDLEEQYTYVVISDDEQVRLKDQPPGLYHVEGGWAFRITHRAYLENNNLVRFTL